SHECHVILSRTTIWPFWHHLSPPGTQISLYGLIIIPFKYFPYALLGMDLLMAGPGAAAQAIPGAVVGHLWWMGVFGTELGGTQGGVLTEWDRTPKWSRSWFGEDGSPATGRTLNLGGGVNVVPSRARAEEDANANTTLGHRWEVGEQIGLGK
ncbi:hypothetical protein GYMLUDRAFT_695257, partial [Collybiopsis luxurians FD-317 M1]